MALPHVTAGEVARAAEQNDLIDTVNSHTGSITSASNIIGDHESRLDTVEAKPSGGSNAGTYFGQWTDANNGGGTTIYEASGGGRPGVKVTDIGTAIGTPVGCTLSAGTFTPTYAGTWALYGSVQYAANSPVRAMYFAISTAANSPTGSRYGLIGGPQMDAQSTSVALKLNANQAVSIYAACWTTNASVQVWRALGNNVTAVWLGP